MSNLELFGAARHDSLLLALAAPALIALLLAGCGYINWQHKKRRQAIAGEMQRLMRVYVTEGRWDPQDTLIGRQAQATLKARVIIKS